MKPVVKLIGDSFLYSCSFAQTHAYEEFVPEHVLVYQISGQTQIYSFHGEMVLKEGQVLLARRNQFAKSVKIPAKGRDYQCVSVLLTQGPLQQFALDKGIVCEERYNGPKNILLESKAKLKGYFSSLLPYVQEKKMVSKKLDSTKLNEAILLLLEMRPELKSFLFDFSDPQKQDLEEFMLKNFHYNTPIKNFARLSGRSLTSFKRDFKEIFQTSPGSWLINKRLSEAYYLIKKKHLNPRDIYLGLGFENLSHFYTSFKKKYGHTPAETKI
jgi:AraC-like DNA-binding protein